MPSKTASLAAFGAAAGAGAAAEFLLDPENGKRRRHVLRDQLAARLRREATPPGRDASELNDPALEAKVESELLRPADAPKGPVDVNVQDGVVFLRGEVPSGGRAEELARRASEVDGVRHVESLLHLPGEPAPHHAGA